MLARLLIFSSDDANMRYAAGLHVPDPFIYAELANKKYILVSKLEYSRAKREASEGAKIVLWDDVKLDNIKKPVQRRRNLADVAAAFLLSHGASQVEIPQNFWALHKQTLEEHGVRTKIEAPFFPERRVKTQEDVKKIKAVGLVAKKAYKRALEILKESTIEWNDTLNWNGDRLTAEILKMEIELVFLAHGCSSGETIVACAEQSAEPHNRGSGPLKAGQPIILDLFPRDTATGYFFDMTRTVVKGTPSKELSRMYDAVKKAQTEALGVLAPGKAGLVHKTVQDVFHKLGYKTTDSEGFIHGTGHGLGLEIHEWPRLGEDSEDMLEPGAVVTVEPGLYYADVGGVRIEDTVVITKDGHTNLTNVPKTLIVK